MNRKDNTQSETSWYSHLVYWSFLYLLCSSQLYCQKHNSSFLPESSGVFIAVETKYFININELAYSESSISILSTRCRHTKIKINCTRWMGTSSLKPLEHSFFQGTYPYTSHFCKHSTQQLGCNFTRSGCSQPSSRVLMWETRRRGTINNYLQSLDGSDFLDMTQVKGNGWNINNSLEQHVVT